MIEVSTVLALLCIVTLLAFWTRESSVPYPTIMVLVGVAIACVPGLPNIQLTPDVVFLIFLPPLLYAAAWEIPIHEFRKNLRPIALLAFGLVFVTTLVVGVVAHAILPGIPWAAAFAIGAIISPPDAIAATAITRKLRVPQRIVVILEGESLLNDASGLVAYKLAVIAAAGSMITWSGAIEHFVWTVVVGVVIGIGVGWCVIQIHRRLDEPVIETVISMLTPFAAYLMSESVHGSGVLAVVTTGLMVRQRASLLFSSATRLHASAVWECIEFVLSGLTFIFIGLGMREVVRSIRDEEQLYQNLVATGVILFVTISVRIAWVFPAAYLPRLLSASLRKRDPMPPSSHLTMIAWTGMRGVVSLAAALALPSDFPYRNPIQFVVFGVILGTLVLQGLTLPWLVRWLRIEGSGRSVVDQELDARLHLLASANVYLDQRETHGLPTEEVEYLRSHFRGQADTWLARLELDEESVLENQSNVCHSTYVGVLNEQRRRLYELQREGIVEEHLVQKIARELDMEETRIASIASS